MVDQVVVTEYTTIIGNITRPQMDEEVGHIPARGGVWKRKGKPELRWFEYQLPDGRVIARWTEDEFGKCNGVGFIV